MTVPTEPEVPRYRFGPLQRRGLVAGWRGGQIAIVAVSLVVAVVVLRARPSVSGAVVALAIVGLAVGAATWPIGGRTAEEWAPDAWRHAAGIPGRRRSSRSNPFTTLRVLDVELGPGEQHRAAVVFDGASRTYTAVLRVAGRGFVLLGPEDKARRVGGWSSALSSLALQGSVIHRVQWVERSLSDDGAAIRDHLRTAATLDGSSDPRTSYGALVEAEFPATCRHEVFVAIAIHAGRAARAVKIAGGGDRGACTVLLRDVASLRRRLSDASLDVGSVLDADELGRVVRASFDTAPAIMGPTPESGERYTPRPAPWPWPMGLSAEWGRVHADGTWHATFWISQWPRTDVGPDFLGPLLLWSSVRRSVAVVMEPVGPLAAARRIEQARTADIADAELRRRGGFLATARRRREEEVLARREVELADGHAEYRFTGYVTVSTEDPESLEEACGQVEQAAGQAGLEIRRCYGDQAMAFTSTLPLCRGLT